MDAGEAGRDLGRATSTSLIARALGALPHPVLLLDPDGACTFANERWLACIGVVPDGRTWLARVHPDDRPAFERSAEAATLRLETRDGSYRWFDVHVAPAGPGLRLATFTDVDDAHRTRLELTRRETQLGLLAQVAPGVILTWRWSPDGTRCLPFAGASLVDLCGLEPQAVRHDSSPLLQAIHPDDRPRVLAGLETSAQALSIWRSEFRVRHPVRGELWAEAHLVPTRDPDGGLTWHGCVTDVTDRRRTADALGLSRAQLVAAQEGGGLGTWTYDLRTRLAWFDDGALRLVGLTREEVRDELGGDALKLVHVDDRARLASDLEAHAAGRTEALATEVRVLRRDGALRWLATRGRVERGPDGQPWRVVGAAMDVTEHLQMQAALAASERLFVLAFEASPSGTVLMRYEDGRLVAANAAYLKLTGRSREDVLGPAGWRGSVVGPADRLEALRRQYIGTGRVVDEELQLRRPDGTLRDVLVSVVGVDLGGERYALATFVDVSESRRATEAVRAGEERFRQLAETIREVFWLATPDQSQLLYVSPAYETVWGRSVARRYEHPLDWLDGVHPDDRARVAAALRDKLVAGTYDEEYRVARPDGSIRWIRDRALPVCDPAGRPIRVAGVAEDVTDRRKLEAQLRQAQKMESVGQLAGGVAHDFNNSLTVISGCTDYLLDVMADDDPSRELVLEIRGAGERAALLTKQLLAFSRQQMLEPRLVDLNSIVADTEKMLRRLVGEDVSVETVLEATSSRVRADPGHLVQVLMNLAVNARDAMPTGGQLTLTTVDVDVDDAEAAAHVGLRPGPHVVLAVSDSGEGMSAEVKAHLFEPFFTTKGVGKGSGLGLAVIHGIVVQSGWHIEVDSEPGHGTTFFIYIPAAEEALPGVSRTADDVAARGTETVLIVEDEEHVRRVAVRGLQAQGYRVLDASDGQAALAVLEHHSGAVHLVVTDVVMPNVDGPRLAQQVQRRFPAVKVLYTSGYTDDAVLRHGVQRAEVAFLQKPYSPATLVRRIRDLLDRPPQA